MTFTRLLLLGLLSSLAPHVPRAEVSLAGIFGDHAVLQRGERSAIWGAAAAGETVTVTLGELPSVTTTADAQGRWAVMLDLRRAPEVPHTLIVRGDNTLEINDVIVGDVWLCSGQSNMEWKLAQTTDAAREIAASANPRLRAFLPTRQTPASPAADLGGRWIVAGPETSGRFSGVAYYFAKTVQASEKVAIGLVDTSWGGTSAEAWISSDTLDLLPESRARKDAMLAEHPANVARLLAFPRDYAAWARRHSVPSPAPAGPAAYASPELPPDESWKVVRLPGELKTSGLPDRGVFWLRRDVEIPRDRAGIYLPLLLGDIRDFEEIYWNGKKIGETTPHHSTSFNPEAFATPNRRYDVPAEQVKAGRNTLAIRLTAPMGGAAVLAPRLTAGWSFVLDGEWRAKVETEWPAPSADAAAEYPRRPPVQVMGHYMPTYLYNGLVHPLRGLSLRGVIWYQGEANTGRAAQYRHTFPLLIQNWRETLGRPDLPFYFCQLANYGTPAAVPAQSPWAELREAQASALALPATGMAVLIDLGETADIHPRGKREVGARLAALALAGAYGRDVPSQGPALAAVAREEGKLRLRFTRAEPGLVAKPLPATYRPKSISADEKPLVSPAPGSQLQGFAVCGTDRRWEWAQARIEGDSVVVWSDKVPEPVHARYAWADSPVCNLYNGAGFPASPFRTDDFALVTTGKTF